MSNPDLELDTGHETKPLLHREKSWTRMDKLLLVFGVVVNLGDGAEIYLPGSSNIKVSRSLAGLVKTAKAPIIFETPCLSNLNRPLKFVSFLQKTITSNLKAPFFVQE